MFERVETPRLILRRPLPTDAHAIFTRYASDPIVTRYLSWPRHTSLQATYSFIDLSDAEWSGWPAGPYLVESRQDGTLLGSTGLDFEAPDRASTGYVFAQDAWGKGYATEALNAVVDIARKTQIARLYALVHPDNQPSVRLLERCGFASEGILPKHTRFPNLDQHDPCDVLCYATILA